MTRKVKTWLDPLARTRLWPRRLMYSFICAPPQTILPVRNCAAIARPSMRSCAALQSALGGGAGRWDNPRSRACAGTANGKKVSNNTHKANLRIFLTTDFIALSPEVRRSKERAMGKEAARGKTHRGQP